MLVVLAALGALLAVPASASAAQPCGRQVIDDWYDDGRVDGTYALHCYDDAIEILPRDVRDYSSAKDDIQRALQNRLRGDAAPPATTDPSPGDPDDPVGSDDEPGTETTGGTGGTGDPGGGSEPGSGGAEAAPPADAESASSVPLPLLILAGLALLLVAGGSAGYLLRRVQARRVPPPAV
jgi:hypothetical protein